MNNTVINVSSTKLYLFLRSFLRDILTFFYPDAQIARFRLHNEVLLLTVILAVFLICVIFKILLKKNSRFPFFLINILAILILWFSAGDLLEPITGIGQSILVWINSVF